MVMLRNVAVVAFTSFFSNVCAQAPFNGIHKNTFVSSDPHSVYQWLAGMLPTECLHSGGYELCDTGVQCGYIGRLSLKHNASLMPRRANSSKPTDNAGFGLHAVNALARPDGGLSAQLVEQLFEKAMNDVRDMSGIPPLLDFATVLYSEGGLDSYISSLQKSQQKFIPISWRDDQAMAFWSLIVLVPKSQIVLELVSRHPPATPLSNNFSWYPDQQPRLPASVFTDMNAFDPGQIGYLVPLAVSKAASNLRSVEEFYFDGLQATTTLAVSGQNATRCFKLPGAWVHLRFVARNNGGDATVRMLEVAKRAAHKRAMAGPLCGFSKWMDNHWAWDQAGISEGPSGTLKLDLFMDFFIKRNYSFHLWGRYGHFLTPNIYAEDPTGDVVQIDGWWDTPPQGAVQDALMDLCGQGNCTTDTPSSCMDALNGTCGVEKGHSSECFDCGYWHFDDLLKSECTNADIVQWCAPNTTATTSMLV